MHCNDIKCRILAILKPVMSDLKNQLGENFYLADDIKCKFKK